MQIGSAVFS